jgi:AcrR family transcriptional regulator
MELNSEISSSPVAAPTLSRRSQQKETHERIVKASLRLFERQGFAGTRTQDIAEEAGISHGSIFVHFKTRDELLVYVCQRFLSAVDARTRQGIRGSAGLEPFLHAHMEAISAHEVLYTRLVQELSALPAEVRAMMLETQSAVAAHLKMVLRKDDGFLNLGPSEHSFLFNAWMGVLTYYLLNRDNFTTSEQLLKESGAEIVELFLKLVHAKRGLTQ